MIAITNASAHQLPLAAGTVHCGAMSPPYFGLRKYSGDQAREWPAVSYSPIAGMPPITVPAMSAGLGAEPTIEAYIGHLILVLRECRRVLRDDGVLWLNLGDSFNSTNGFARATNGWARDGRDGGANDKKPLRTLAQGQLMLVPHRVALAAQGDGWVVRNDVVWHKTAPMPESVRGWRWQQKNGEPQLRSGSWRHTRAHEFVFMLSKRMGYWSDGEAVRTALKPETIDRYKTGFAGNEVRDNPAGSKQNLCNYFGTDKAKQSSGANPRSVLSIGGSSYKGAHYAVYPPALIEPLIRATCPARCCSECGRGWAAVVTKSSVASVASKKKAAVQTGGTKTSVFSTGEHKTYKSVGYRPTCECNAPAVPGTVLDPFAGSGTTGEVCRKLGRSFIGFDISREYLTKQARVRCGIGEPEAVALAGFGELL